MATTSDPTGLLAYGEDDGTVIWRSPLTSEASISSPDIGGGTYTKVGTGQVFDSQLGLLPGAAGYYYVSNLNNNALLDFGGQLTFQVSTALLACAGSTCQGSSGGTPQTAAETLVGMSDSVASTSSRIFGVNVSNKAIYLFAGYQTGTTNNGGYVSDAIGKESYTTIHATWNGTTVALYINGCLMVETNKGKNFPTNYSLHFGRYPMPSNAVQPLTTGYIRNVQLSYRRTTHIIPPGLSKAQVLGDSYADDTTAWTTPAYDISKYHALNKILRSKGMQLGGWNVQSYGGRKVIGSGNAALYMIDNVPTALAQSPTLGILQTGANDFTNNGTMDAAAFLSSYKTLVETYMGVNGNPSSTLKKLIVCSTPWAPQYPNVATARLRKTDAEAQRKAISQIPAWWNATYPAKAGQVMYRDVFSDFGGFGVDASLFDSGDVLHPSPRGRYVMGTAWGNGILKALR
jgi:hypothetical protein